MKNSEVVEIYLRFKKDRVSLIRELEKARVCDTKTLPVAVDTWIRHFDFRWKNSHGRRRFDEKYSDWLDRAFMVMILILLCTYTQSS